ncbi:MAG: c-type cytochrome [Planctomycetales bacterium]|nr:c-type cytochrome [Planctomycetales bacterium]
MRKMALRCVLCWYLLLAGSVSVWSSPFAYLDAPLDPYYVHRDFPRLTTPQWVGDEGVDAVVVLAIDDMRDTAKYEQYLRPILDRLGAVDGRAALSVMTCVLDDNQALREQWRREGVSIEVHTADHPCPLLQGGDLAAAKSTYDRCVDQLNADSDQDPVAFRMPCCDSLNTPSPRFWTEIFNRRTPAGNYLAMDSSVFNITTERDRSLPAELRFDEDGRPKFRKYLPFPSFVNTIEDYPYPYVIGRTCWEFPCMVPSDWEAQNLQQPNNPRTVDDLKAALDVTVRKQGVMNVVFHPHGWIRNDQMVDFISYADKTYGRRVKFLSFRDALQRLNEQLLLGTALRDEAGADRGVRLLDVNQDGYLDVVIPDANAVVTRVWLPEERAWRSGKQALGASRVHFGCLDSGVVVMATCDAADRAPRLWSWDRQAWSEMSVEWGDAAQQPSPDFVAQAKRLDGLRFHDVDSDGRDELLLTDGESTNLFMLRGLDNTRYQASKLPFSLPPGAQLIDREGRDAGLRFVDINEDGFDDVVYSAARRFSVHLFRSTVEGYATIVVQGTRDEQAPLSLPMIVRPDGSNNGCWAHSGHLWFQNEDTNRLPDLVDRVAFADLLALLSSEPSQAKMPSPRSPDQALLSFETADGFHVELVACEPLIEDPVAFDWGTDGELWVVEMRDYPSGMNGQGKFGGRVKRLTDENGDGRYDRSSVFLDNLPFPTGVACWDHGILVTAAPDLIYAEDTDGDGVADVREVLYSGFREGNQQHRVNGLRWGLDNWLYLANGESGGSVRSTKTGQSVSMGGRDLRVRPATGEVEAVPGPTQFVRSRDDDGNWFGGNNSSPLTHYLLEEQYVSRNPHHSPARTRREISRPPGAAPVFPVSPLLPRFNDFDRADRFTSACSHMVYRDQWLFGEGSSHAFVCEPVHNLISRFELNSDGFSFVATRPAEEQNAEFVASRDNWCRPVMVRTGPDGALWFADMYRLVIEHPEWIPREWQEQLDLRAGTNRGRIYRVVANDRKMRRWGSQCSATTLQLVEMLGNANGWQRDRAQQMLLWRKATEARAQLESLVAVGHTEQHAVHALCTLDGLGEISVDVLRPAILSDRNVLARHAVRLAEKHVNDHAELGEAMLARATDIEDAQLGLQLAYSLGSWDDARAAEGLATLLVRWGQDEVLRDAVFSSLTVNNIVGVLSQYRQSMTAENVPPRPELIRSLSRMVAAMAEPGAVTMLFTSQVEEIRREGRGDLRLIAELCEQLKKSNRAGLLQQMKVAPGWADVVRSTRESATNLAQDESAIRAAWKVLTLTEMGDEKFMTDSLRLCNSQTQPSVQQAVIDAYLTSRGTEGISEIVELSGQLSPAMRDYLNERLLSRSEWSLAFLNASEGNGRSLASLNTRVRSALLHSRDERVKRRAEELIGRPQNTDRVEVVAKMVDVTTLASDAQRGQAVFSKTCATCHQIGQVGKAIGPDLAALTDRSPASLLTAILDPNRAVEDRYWEYLVHLNDGSQLTGMIRSETSTGITLVTATGEERTILRSEIDELSSLSRSFMPEGFEKDLTRQDLADVMAFVRQAKIPRKLFDGNMPRIAPMRDDGSIRLFAMYSRIYGPSLVFEPQYRNLGYWESPNDHAVWDVNVPRAGKYHVTLDYACDPPSAGNVFHLQIGDQVLSGRVEATGGWDEYDWKGIGSVQLPAGKFEALMRSEGPIEGVLLDLRTIILSPAGE